VKRCDDEEEWQRLELGGSTQESGKRLGIEGKWCEGGSRAFIWVGRASVRW
jgi:hypothetical protein